MFLSMEQIASFFTAQGGKANDNMPIVDIKFVHCWNGSPAAKDNALTVINASDLNLADLSDEETVQVFICREDVPLSEDVRMLRHIHIIRVPESTSLLELVNIANSIFVQANNSLENYDKILEAVSKPDDFRNVASAISGLVSCPVVLVAGTKQILSSCEYDLDPEEWNSYINARLLKLSQVPDKLNYEKFFINPLTRPYGIYQYEAIFPVFSDFPARLTSGMIYILCNDPLIPASYSKLLHFVAHTMSWLFTRYANKDNLAKLENQAMTFLLMDLLHGIVPSDNNFYRVLSSLRFKTDRNLVLICIRDSSLEDNNFDISKKIFMEFFEDSFSFTYSTDVFILTTPDWLQPDNKAIQKKFTESLKESGCYAGISSIFYSIDKFFVHHYSRALSAANAAIRLKEKRRWTDFRAVSLLCLLNNDYARITHFCDPALIRLVEYDKKHESDNLYTLCVYWQLNRDIGRICEFLHIHKNTLYYRLRKIAGILRQDINDYDNFIQLSMSISLMEDFGAIPRYRIFDKERSQQKWQIYEDSQEE